MKKKILTLGLVAALSATAAIGGTLAYFTDSKVATNTFTVGNVQINLTEPNWPENGVDDIYPGQTLAKDPTVTNIGKNECFVRLKVTNLKQFGTEGDIVYYTDEVANALGAGWVKDATEYEGYAYFYWTSALQPGEPTTALFDHIQMPAGLTNGKEDNYSKGAQDIVVTADAVQSQGFTGSATSVADLKTWFDTCLGN